MPSGRQYSASKSCSRVGVSLAALALGLLSSPAFAQARDGSPPPGGETAADQEIVVTASRVERAGFTAPTPTTVITEADMQLGGRTGIGAVLADLPQFRPTSTPQSTSSLTIAGTASADLRGLGEARTLVLINGRRPVATNSRGFNLNTVPFEIIKRVEVVTGGASAAWGSGAVAGVVNIILDDDLGGLRATAQYGISSRGDGAERQLGLAYGADFAGGRGHFMIAGEYVENEGLGPRTSRSNVGGWALFSNPDRTPTNGLPAFLIRPNARYSRATLGGVIVSGPLAGIEFGQGGVPEPFVYGSLRGQVLMSGGDGSHNDEFVNISAPYNRGNAYFRGTYDLSDAIRFSADLLYSNTGSDSGLFPDNNNGNLTIRVDNAFLPESIRSQLIAAKQTSFLLGRLNADFGIVRNVNRYKTLQGTVALEGDLGAGWSWDAYYTYGETDGFSQVGNQRISSLFAESLDSVISPTTGKPICRSALTVPGTACVPVNLFGYGSPSKEAVAYFIGDASGDSLLTLQVGEASVRGEPFSTWAGPVSVAFGGEWRREGIATEIDELSRQKRFSSFNFGLADGGFTVKEAFAEAVVPIAQGLPLMNSLILNGAYRISDYSTSGTIPSWKIGATNDVTKDLKLRATKSRDIRAPNMAELFTTSQVLDGVVADPKDGKQYAVRTTTGGNPNLNPERADTLTAGIIYRPSWVNGLNISADYYSIKVDGAITVIPGQQIVNRCAAGATAFCSRITRDSSGGITAINSPFINLSRYEISGVDFEMAYNLPAAALASSLKGNLGMRLLVNYVDKLIVDDGVSRIDFIGEMGPGGPTATGVPHWRGTLSATYNAPNWMMNARARYLGSGIYSATQDIENNRIDARVYLDFGAEYSFGRSRNQGVTLFANIVNALDQAPPVYSGSVHFDLMGRYFNFGVRAAF